MVEPIWERNPEDESEPSRRQNRPHSSEIQTFGSVAPWTSARCNRLLRPISSKIAALRKARQARLGEDETPQETCQCNWYRVADVCKGAANDYGKMPSYSANTAETAISNSGDEWTSSPRPLKKIKRTYSSKNRSQVIGGANQKEHRVQPAYPPREREIGLPRNFAFSSCQSYIVPFTSMEGNPYPLQNTERNTLPEVARRTASEERRLLDGICKGLVALLKATSSEPSSRKSCRSLFSTCLRQVPKYVRKEEMLSKTEDPTNDDDISSAVYNDLEELGSLPGAGWNPLREVVRAHGISMVGEAIREGAIAPADARHISCLCLALSAYDEAQCILESMTMTEPSADKQPSKEATLSVGEARAIYNSMEKFVSHTGRQGIVYRQTAAMLNNSILPLEWMSSKVMISHWNGMIRSITQGDEHARSATILIQSTLSKWYKKAGRTPFPDVHDIRMRLRKALRRPALRSVASSQAAKAADMQSDLTHAGISLLDDANDGLYDTIFDVLTVFSAISLLRDSEPAQNSHNAQGPSMPILQGLGLEVRQALEIVSYNTDFQHASNLSLERLCLPLLAAGMSRMMYKRPTEQLYPDGCLDLTFLARLPTSNEFLGNAGSFFCAVARCCAKARCVDAFDFIQAMVNDSMALSTSKVHDKVTKGLYGRIALAAAFEFSEGTSQPDHLNWALDVELAINGEIDGPSKPSNQKTPARGTTQSKNAYRWEEGICEWIAKTPALALRKQSDPKADASQEERTAEAPVASLKQPCPLLSELTPCAMNKKPARAESRLPNAKEKAFDIHVNAGVDSYGDENALDQLCLAKTHQHPRRVTSNPRLIRKIYLDDDLDELSAPDSSQEKSSVISTLQELPTKRCGVKRKMHAGLRHRANTSRLSAKYTVPPVTKYRLEIDASDMEDELGFP